MPRRLAITGPHQVEVLDYEEPPLQAHQVRIKTELASGKHGTTLAGFDAVNFQGQRFDQKMRLFVEEPAPASPAPPGIHGTGTSGVGTVVEVGPEVATWKAGDRVFGLMDIREANVCHEDRLWELGDIDPCLALCVEPAYVAFHCVRESQVRFGESVAVVGLGALGLLAAKMAVESGAENVFAIDPLPKRREWALRNGADAAFDPTDGDAAIRVHERLGGPGVDVAIELAGTYPALYTAIRCATRAVSSSSPFASDASHQRRSPVQSSLGNTQCSVTE